jgi:4-amino-4-deoxy-L-arabinose transferase-like glycosyltransferase
MDRDGVWRWAVAALWAALVLGALHVRPYLPIDETRYVSVAWAMYDGGGLLVPLKNGIPYSDKPPLMFWLVVAGWKLLGVNDWWPRIAMPAFALLSLGLTAQLARRLWPGLPGIPALAAIMLTGCALWAAFVAAFTFDAMLTFFALLALLGVLRAARGHDRSGWALFGLGIGLGVLAKGPVILLHVLPVALAAPWWLADVPRGGWRRWYVGVLGGVLVGAAIALAWAIPAAVSGGPRFASQLLWGQSANRVMDSFAHARPVWWYLLLLPLMLFPWVAWAPVWRGWRSITRSGPDMGLRFVLAWALPTLAAFSLVSGKQPHYLLPLMPAAALLGARAAAVTAPASRAEQVPIAVVLIATGVALAVYPDFGRERFFPADQRAVLAPTAIAIGLVGAAVVAVGWRSITAAALALATAVTAVALAADLGPVRALASRLDVGPTARFLKAQQDAGRPIVHVGRYDAQYQFAGRLTRPLEEVDPTQAPRWAQRHPDGVLVDYAFDACPQGSEAPVFARRYRGRYVCIFRGSGYPQ